MPSPPSAERRARPAAARARRLAAGLALAVAVGGGTVVVGAPADAAPVVPVVLAELPAPTADPAEVKEKADEIVSGSEYQVPERTILDDIKDWFARRLTELLGGGGSVPTWVSWTVLLGVVALVGYAVYRFTRSTRPDPVRGVEVHVEVSRSSEEWVLEAERLEARGQWKLALRARYRALVGDLVQREKVRDIPGRTTGEHRGDVAAALPDATEAFAGASDLFDEAWYGDRPTGAEENARFRSLAGEVLEKAGRS
jgi:hypothetical protein